MDTTCNNSTAGFATCNSTAIRHTVTFTYRTWIVRLGQDHGLFSRKTSRDASNCVKSVHNARNLLPFDLGPLSIESKLCAWWWPGCVQLRHLLNSVLVRVGVFAFEVFNWIVRRFVGCGRNACEGFWFGSVKLGWENVYFYINNISFVEFRLGFFLSNLFIHSSLVNFKTDWSQYLNFQSSLRKLIINNEAN